jgi:hypothetical protein
MFTEGPQAAPSALNQKLNLSAICNCLGLFTWLVTLPNDEEL